MIKARILRSGTLNMLRAEVENNLHRYRSGGFSFLDTDSSQYRELESRIDLAAVKKLKISEGISHFEVENCLAMSKILPELSPYEARDERLWTYLTHTYLLDYARGRWTIPKKDEDATAHILKHFFAKDKRGIERDNAGSRLWWMGHLCQRVDGLNVEKSLRAFLHKSDVRASIVERPTSSQSIAIFSAILKKLSKSLAGKEALFERTNFRALMTHINSIGGFKLLDFLDETAAEQLLDGIIKDKLKLQYI